MLECFVLPHWLPFKTLPLLSSLTFQKLYPRAFRYPWNFTTITKHVKILGKSNDI